MSTADPMHTVRQLVAEGRLDDADFVLRTASPVWATDAALARGELALARGHWRLAGECFDAALAKRDCGRGWRGRAMAQLALGAPDAAVEAARGAVALAPEDALGLAILGRCLFAVADLEGARAALQHAKARSDTAAIRTELARVAAAAGSPEAALVHAHAALDLDADWLDAYEVGCQALVNAGRAAEAVAWVTGAVFGKPIRVRLGPLLLELFERTDQTDAATELATLVADLALAVADAAVLEALGRFWLDRRVPQAAEPLLRAAVAADPRAADAWAALALALHALGRADEAALARKSAQSLGLSASHAALALGAVDLPEPR